MKKRKAKFLKYLSILVGSLAANAAIADAKLLSANAEKVVPNKYIVVLKENKNAVSLLNKTYVSGRATAATNLTRGKVHGLLEHSVKGYIIEAPEAEIKKLLKQTDIDYIEPVQTVTLEQTQTNPAWGLDRIDQQNLPLNNAYNYTLTGLGVNAYVIDTGINTGHSEFTGHIGHTVSMIGGTEDCAGHGTHVAGTLGGTTYGVAKGVTLHSVKVFGCSTSTDTGYIVQGIDWVRANALHPAVANMSLGGPVSAVLDQATLNLINSGTTVVVAGGNENGDACVKSPAHVASAITVGASTSGDVRSSFSNSGNCIDIWAPGTGILSAWIGGPSATNVIDGTSMASPHVAGAAALYLQYNTAASPTQVAHTLYTSAAIGKLSGSIGSASLNRLVNTASLLATPPYIWRQQSISSSCPSGYAPPGGGRVGATPLAPCTISGALGLDMTRGVSTGVGPTCFSALICQ